MKKKILGWFTAFALAFVLGSVTFSEDASASTIKGKSINNITNATTGEWEECYRYDKLATYSESKRWNVDIQNWSTVGGEYMIRIYKSGTKTILFEKSGYIGPKTYEMGSFSATTTTLNIDIVVYRNSDIVLTGGTSAAFN